MPPEAFNTTSSPWQIIVELAVAVIVGEGLVVSKRVCVPEHMPSLAVTVYIVLAVGETTATEVVSEPGSQVYPLTAEFALIVAVRPSHIIVGLEATLTDNGATVMVETAELVPHPLEPLTVYMAVETGVKDCPFTTPGLVQV